MRWYIIKNVRARKRQGSYSYVMSYLICLPHDIAHNKIIAR